MKPVRERRIAETVAGSGGGDARGWGGLTVLNGDVCEAGAGLREAERRAWGWTGEVVEREGGVSRALRGAVLPRSARVA